MTAPATRLSALVRLVLAPNASPYTLEGTNTYVVGERAPVVIDPGPADEEHLERVLNEAGEVRLVLLTHRHPDHAEGAERFASLARAPLAAYAGASVGANAIEAVADGQKITVDGATLRAIYTPGHSDDHLSFVLKEERAVFTGDHVLGRGTTVIAYPDGELTPYMDSLQKVRKLKPARLYPGHGPVVEEPGPVLDYYLEHRRERERQVIEAIEAGCGTVTQMVERIYADVDRALHGAAALSVRAHLEKLENDGTAYLRGGRWIL